MNANNEKEVISSKEAAAILEISVATLSRRVKDGKIEALPKSANLERHHRLEFRRSYIEQLAAKKS